MRRLMVCLIVLLAVAWVATGCSAQYVNENGPRGPERIGVRAVWPFSVCNEAPTEGAK